MLDEKQCVFVGFCGKENLVEYESGHFGLRQRDDSSTTMATVEH